MAQNKPDDDVSEEKMKSGTDEPWKKPGQSSQNDNQAPPDKPDLERWQNSDTH
jgi:hypothetical protein